MLINSTAPDEPVALPVLAQTSSESHNLLKVFTDSSVHQGPQLKIVQSKVIFKNSPVGIIIIICLIMSNSSNTG